MKKTYLIITLSMLLSWCQAGYGQRQESISLTTYFPAPMGAYDQFRLIPFDSGYAIGDSCVGNEGTIHVAASDGQLRTCVNEGGSSKWSLMSGAWKQVGKNIIPSDPDDSLHIGIGTSTPNVFLHIHDNENGYNPVLPNIYSNSAHLVGMMITAVDPALALIGQDESVGQSSIHFLEVEREGLANQGNYKNMWTLGRTSSSGGKPCDGCLYVSYLGNPVVGNAWGDASRVKFHVSPEGNIGIGRFGEWSSDGPLNQMRQTAPLKDLHLAFNRGETTVRLQETGDLSNKTNDNVWDLKVIGNAGVDRFSIHGGIEGALKENLVIGAANGYVGIGTTAPQAQMHITPNAGEEALILQAAVNPAVEFIDTNDSDFRILNSGDILSFEYDNGSGWEKAFHIENFINSDGNQDERLIFGAFSAPYEKDSNCETIVHGDGHVLLSDGSASVIFAIEESDLTPLPGSNDVGIDVWKGPIVGPTLFFVSHATMPPTKLFTIRATGQTGTLTPIPSHDFDVGTAPGFYCHNGSWTYSSSRQYKDDIQPLELSEALTALKALRPMTFRYKEAPDELRAGFISEEMPGLLATKDKKTVSANDILATLTKAAQHLADQVEKRNRILKEQENLLQEMKAKLNNL